MHKACYVLSCKEKPAERMKVQNPELTTGKARES